MADSFIQVPPDSTGKLVDAEQLTVGSNTVQRQRHEISGASAAEIVRVLNSQPAGSEYGIVVREAQKGQAAMASSQPVALASDQSAIPVSQSGTWTVQPGNTANTTAWKVDGSAVTQPVSGTVTTSPPTNASTNVAQVAGTTTDTNSGTKSAGTLRVVIATDQPALTNKLLVTADPLAAGTNLIGKVSSSAETSTMYNGTTALTPLFATIVASSSGVTNLVALVSSKQIRVLALSLVANAAVNVKFQSHVTPTDLTGLHYLAANGGFVLPYNPVGWFQTISGEALDINLSGAVAVGGCLVYVTV